MKSNIEKEKKKKKSNNNEVSWLKTEGAALQSNNDVYQENGTHFPISNTIGGPQEV